MKTLLKLAFIALLLSFFIPPASAQIALVQGCSAGNTGGSPQSCTLTGITAHNHVVVNYVSTITASGGCDNGLLTDSQGLISGLGNQTQDQCVLVSGTVGFGTWVTLRQSCVDVQTFSGNDTFQVAGGSPASITAGEYSGLASTGTSFCSVDGAGNGAVTGGGPPSVPDSGPISTGTQTTTNAGDLIVASGFQGATGTATITVPSGFTQEDYVQYATNFAQMTAYQIPGSTGSYSPTFAIGGTPSNWLGVQVAYPPGSTVGNHPRSKLF